MGRLFWKILFTFWLTLLVAAGITGLAVWLHQQNLYAIERDIVVQPVSALSVEAAANTLKYGGIAALQGMLAEQQRNAPERIRVYAVNDEGLEILGREVSAATLTIARQGAEQQIKPPVAVAANYQGVNYVLFAPKSGQFPEFQQNNKRLLPPHDSSWLLISAGIILSFISSFLLAWYFAKPIRSLRLACRLLAAGDLTQRVAQAMGGGGVMNWRI